MLLRRIIRDVGSLEHRTSVDAHIGTILALFVATKLDDPEIPSGDELVALAEACVVRAAAHPQTGPELEGGRAGLACALWFAATACDVELGEDVLAQIDDSLTSAVEPLLARGAIDLLYGVSGLAVVGALRSAEPSGRRLMERCADAWIRHGHAHAPFFPWAGMPFGECVDHGVAHGLAGILAPLAACARHGVATAIDLRRMLDYLGEAAAEALRGKEDANGNVLPGAVYADGRRRTAPSPSAWCYGELGVTTALVNAHATLGISLPPVLERLVARAGAEGRSVPPTQRGFAPRTLCHGESGTLTMLRRLSELHEDHAVDAARARVLRSIVTHVTEETLDAFERERTALDAPSGSILAGEAGVFLTLSTELGAVSPRWDVLLGIRSI